MTGFLRNGYCEVPPEDFGNHSVAAIVTDEFLDFSASQGNNLRDIGLTGGCKWCLCASRQFPWFRIARVVMLTDVAGWKEAFDARKGDQDKVVPK